MSLIPCKECGREISDKALSCPYCGCPIEEKHTYATFKIERESKAFFCAVKYEVLLDNKTAYVLGNGDTFQTQLECGNHHIELIDKNNFNRSVYNQDFYLSRHGLLIKFAAAVNPSMIILSLGESNQPAQQPPTQIKYKMPPHPVNRGGRACPKCGSIMTIQTVSESRKAGCFTVLLYVLLALTIFGLLIVIPLMLRKKTETVTYAVCQSCGYRRRV